MPSELTRLKEPSQEPRALQGVWRCDRTFTRATNSPKRSGASSHGTRLVGSPHFPLLGVSAPRNVALLPTRLLQPVPPVVQKGRPQSPSKSLAEQKSLLKAYRQTGAGAA